MSLKFNLEQFIAKSKKIHGDLYDYSISNYINYHENIDIICKKHGSFKKRVKHHLRGIGCNECTNENMSEKNSPWTPEMDDYLKKNFQKQSAKQLSKKFNLCKQTIYNRISKLNLKRDTKPLLHHTIPLFFWNSMKRGAKYRDLTFDITPDDVWNLFIKQNKKCALTGWDIQFNKIKYKNTASVDRIDSNIGYLKDNIQIVHKKINRFKMAFSVEELLEMCKGIVQNNKNKNIPRKISWELDILNDTEYPIYFK
jgi:hypothetical protein